jgi:chromate transport protein ChrA
MPKLHLIHATPNDRGSKTVVLEVTGISTPGPVMDELDPALREMGLLPLFTLFLTFGLRAWGGPMAQIDMLRAHFVDGLGWISKSRFNRVLAVYQALPGPEATELACYFGMLSRGRIGAVLGGLGFLLPGFIMMLLISFLYVRYGIANPVVQRSMAAVQPCVAAMVVRAVHRISATAFHDEVYNSISMPLILLAILAAIQNVAGINFFISLVYGGLLFCLIRKAQQAGHSHGEMGSPSEDASISMDTFGASASSSPSPPLPPPPPPPPPPSLLATDSSSSLSFSRTVSPRANFVGRYAFHIATALFLAAGLAVVLILSATVGLSVLTFGSGPGRGLIASNSLPGLFALGLLAGLLTFGGAYTAIPFVQQDAVIAGKWLAAQAFLDGIAVAQIIPAPLVMFSTFVGYLGGGLLGALLMTVGMFLPAFSFTLIGHNFFERIVKIHTLRFFLEGITGSVIGLIAVTAIQLITVTVTSPQTTVVFGTSLGALYALHSPWTSPLLVMCAAVAGQVLMK